MENTYSKVVINDYNGDLSQRWYVYFSFQDPDNGKMKPFKYFISQRFKTRTARFNDAARLRDYYREKLKTGWTPFSKSGGEYTTLANAVSFYLENRKPPVMRPRTYNSYKSHLSFFTKYLIKNKVNLKYVNEFSKFDAQKFMYDTRIAHKHSNRTHNNLLTTMRTMWNFFIKMDYCTKNIFLYVDALMEEQPSIIPFTLNELSIISNTLPSYNVELWEIAQLIFYCFLRCQEIVRLKFENFDLDRGLIFTDGVSTKNKESKAVVIPTQFLKNINVEKFNSFPKEWYVYSKKLKPGTDQISIARIDELWMKYRDKHGLGKKHIYWLKHTGNGEAIDSGINIRDIQEHNRHSSLEYTQKYAIRLRPSTKIAEQFPNLDPKLRTTPIIADGDQELNIENLISLLSKQLKQGQESLPK